jgi:hypothetical protein
VAVAIHNVAPLDLIPVVMLRLMQHTDLETLAGEKWKLAPFSRLYVPVVSLAGWSALEGVATGGLIARQFSMPTGVPTTMNMTLADFKKALRR